MFPPKSNEAENSWKVAETGRRWTADEQQKYNRMNLRELGSYILRDTPKPWQLKAPGPKPTIKQFKEARKGNGSPRKGNQWPRKGNGPACNRNRGPFNRRKCPLIATVPLTALLAGPWEIPSGTRPQLPPPKKTQGYWKKTKIHSWSRRA